MKRLNLIYASILIFINLFFTACTTISVQNSKTVPVEDLTVVEISNQDTKPERQLILKVESEFNVEANSAINNIQREESIIQQLSNPVALAFLKDADKYTKSGDSDRAVASLERGLDIEPKNPWLWNRLASVRLKQKKWGRAITLAKKSNAFASGHNQLQKDNWQVITEAKMALNDVEGARKAKEMVERFSREKT